MVRALREGGIEEMWRLGRSVAVVMLFVLAATSICNSALADCQDNLVGNSYDCTIALEVEGHGAGGGIITTDDCIEFVTGGLSANFDLVGVSGFGGEFGCACQVQGGIYSSRFRLSPDAFGCVGPSENVAELHGKIDSDKLRGQGSDQSGTIIQFECKKRRTACE
jgi:hypothetical protein